MFDFKKTITEKDLMCPNCGADVHKVEPLYEDSYRGNTICDSCIEEYKEEVLSEEEGNSLK